MDTTKNVYEQIFVRRLGNEYYDKNKELQMILVRACAGRHTRNSVANATSQSQIQSRRQWAVDSVGDYLSTSVE